MNYFKTLKKYWYLPVALVIVTTVLSLVISFVQTPKYSSTVKLLVIQRQGNSLDAYSAARSAETIASVLTRMIYTTSFFDRVVDSQFKLKNTFAKDPTTQKKEWEKMVSATSPSDGSLEIEIYHTNRDLAEGYALAIAYVLVNNGQEYHGGDNQVEIKMVDKPFTSELPSSPNILQNVTLGVVSGLIFSIAILLFLVFKEDTEDLKDVEHVLAHSNNASNRVQSYSHSHIAPSPFNQENDVSDIDVAFSEPEAYEEIPVVEPLFDAPEEQLPVAEEKRGPMPEHLKDRDKKKDNTNPEKVENWLKSGKFDPSK